MQHEDCNRPRPVLWLQSSAIGKILSSIGQAGSNTWWYYRHFWPWYSYIYDARGRFWDSSQLHQAYKANLSCVASAVPGYTLLIDLAWTWNTILPLSPTNNSIPSANTVWPLCFKLLLSKYFYPAASAETQLLRLALLDPKYMYLLINLE